MSAATVQDVRRWRGAMITAFAIGGITLAAWGTRLPAIADALRIDSGEIGLLLAGVTVGSVCGLLAATALLARLSGRTVIGVLLGVIAVALVLIGCSADLLHSVPLIAVGFLLVGLAIGAFDVTINVEGAALETAAGRTVMPLLHAAWSGGAALGSGIGAGAAWLGIPPSGQFSAEAVVIAAAACTLPRLIPRRPAEKPSMESAEAFGQRLRRRLHSWRDVRLLLIGLVMLGAELGEGSANSWLTLAAQRDHGQAASVAALFFTVFALGEAGSRIAGGPLVDRFGRVRTTRATLALGVVGVALFITAGQWWVLLIGVILWSVGVSMGFPLGMSSAAESGPDPAARVGVVASIGYLANLAGPPAIGFLAQATDLLAALWPVALFFIVAIAAAGSFRSPRPLRPAPRSPQLRDDLAADR